MSEHVNIRIDDLALPLFPIRKLPLILATDLDKIRHHVARVIRIAREFGEGFARVQKRSSAGELYTHS
jgi:hypothetical protein